MEFAASSSAEKAAQVGKMFIRFHNESVLIEKYHRNGISIEEDNSTEQANKSGKSSPSDADGKKEGFTGTPETRNDQENQVKDISDEGKDNFDSLVEKNNPEIIFSLKNKLTKQKYFEERKGYFVERRQPLDNNESLRFNYIAIRTVRNFFGRKNLTALFQPQLRQSW